MKFCEKNVLCEKGDEITRFDGSFLCDAATAGRGEEWELELLEPGDLPAWATQSHIQRVEWVNTLIAQGSPT
jgi:hypothetical protein